MNRRRPPPPFPNQKPARPNHRRPPPSPKRRYPNQLPPAPPPPFPNQNPPAARRPPAALYSAPRSRRPPRPRPPAPFGGGSVCVAGRLGALRGAGAAVCRRSAVGFWRAVAARAAIGRRFGVGGDGWGGRAFGGRRGAAAVHSPYPMPWRRGERQSPARLVYQSLPRKLWWIHLNPPLFTK